MSDKTIFKKIVDKEIPADVVYEDDLCLAFRDVAPQAPVHVLVIPKTTSLRSLDDVTPDAQSLIGHIFVVIQKLARAWNSRVWLPRRKQLRRKRVSNGGASSFSSSRRTRFRVASGLVVPVVVFRRVERACFTLVVLFCAN